ncbi:MAG: S41 family peptidase [Pseudobacter sp.]|uniref:S41 family peptidase n=1 Tax=Pseudobacter sp. TaxID=2045420 RepID=UPI003F7DD5AB
MVNEKTMLKSIVPLSIFIASSQAAAQIPDSLVNHIDSCLAILQQHSLYSKRVNWPSVKAAVLSQIKLPATKEQLSGPLHIAFDALGDKHAVYYHYADEYKIQNPSLYARYSDSIRAAWLKGPRISGEKIGAMAYVRVPYMGVTKQVDIDGMANWLYRTVADLQLQNPSGWIIDLRLNGGGNVIPMLAGLAPFFKDGVVSYYLDKDGNASGKSSFQNGELFIDGTKACTINNKNVNISSAPVAVLIGPGTASSGEITAAVFRQRPCTKLFGESSAGLANSTQGFLLGKDVYFLISTSRIGNKNKKPLPEIVIPDVPVKGNDAFGSIEKDITVQRAIKWLNSKK